MSGEGPEEGGALPSAAGGLPPQVYRDERPADSMRPAHEWARTHEPGWTYPAVRVVMSPPALLLYRCRALGLANVPPSGPMILAPNHFSNLDHFFAGVRLRRQIRFMTKSQFFAANPALDYLFRVSGHFPVRRGHPDDEAFATAHSILDRGGCVGIYAEGGRS
ncbi:MAG: lysophospholipid acyltransferase family protein, partial [Solirubrobacterales bacterium]